MWVSRKGASLESLGFANDDFFNWLDNEYPNSLIDDAYMSCSLDDTLFSVKKNKLYHGAVLVDYEAYDTAIFTFNAELVTKDNYKKIEDVYFWIKENTNIKIINHLDDYALDAQKELYFEHLKKNGLRIPNYKVILSEEDLDKIPFPYILKLNNLHQWRKVYNVREATECYRILKGTIEKDEVQKGLRFDYKFSGVKPSQLHYETKIIAVEFIDNFNGKYCSSSSVSHINGNLFYQYTLPSLEQGKDSIHINDVVDFDIFFEAQEELKEVIKNNKKDFDKVAEISLDTTKIDFLIKDGVPVFLEQGVKIGTSNNIINLEKHYKNMDLNRNYANIMKMILDK